MIRWAWGGARPVHGLGAITHCRRAQAQVLDEPQHPQAVLRGHLVHSPQVFVDDGAQPGIPQVRLRGGR